MDILYSTMFWLCISFSVKSVTEPFRIW
jgi:hypothetical protein